MVARDTRSIKDNLIGFFGQYSFEFHVEVWVVIAKAAKPARRSEGEVSLSTHCEFDEVVRHKNAVNAARALEGRFR